MKSGESILYPYGELDVLKYYAKVSKKLGKFLKGREIATKTMIGNFYFLKRGSNSKPLYVEDFKIVDEEFLKLRAKGHLKDFKNKLNEKEILLWQYFVSRKPMNFFYATNGEGVGKSMDRIFLDIDKGANSSDDARRVALNLVKVIKSDKEFAKLLKFKIFVMWTGKSFHVYLFLKKKIDLGFYQRYLSYGEGKENSFIMKWAKEVSDKTGINVCAGHEKRKGAVILDSSNTPSGKLARVPFSLHLDKNGKIDGVSIPVSEKELGGKNLIKKLEKLSPDKIFKDLNFHKIL